MGDGVWLDTLRTRDERAWRDLHAREFAVLYRFARGLGADAELAEDAVSESFERLLRGIQRIRADSPAALRAWLIVVCRNYLRDQMRRRRPAAEIRDEEAGVKEDGAVERRVAVAAALATLPEAQREVVSLRFIAGLPTRQVAYLTDRSEEAVESLQHRALNALRRGMTLEGIGP